jgi:LysR family transcriptional regulator, pca operon transcriptional activator
MDRRIKIRHLEAFVEIVHRRSLKRAAERLFLTQPAISRTLAELEEIAGAQLLTRGRGGVLLTPQGEFFHGFAQTCLAALERGLKGIEGFEGGASDMKYRIGALPSVAARLLPRLVDEITALAPDALLTITEGPHPHLVRLLKRGELDAVIGRLGEPETMRGLSFTQLYLEVVAIVVRPGHPILADPELRRIGDWPVIYPPESAAIRPLVRRLLVNEGLPLPRRRIETVSSDLGRARTRDSDAIWFISAGVVALEIAEGRLVRLPIDTGATKGPVGLMERAGVSETSEQRLFSQALNRAVYSLGLN